jgi:phage-related protein
MTYSVEFFNEKVRLLIDGWPAGINASFTRIAEQMEVSGPNLGMPYTRSIGNGLFEIRARGAEGIARAFFCALIGRRIVILHGFIKKTQQTPEKEISIARKRMKEIGHG